MKKIIILLAFAALMSLGMFSCDVESARPNTGDVFVRLEDIPNDVKAVSIWCTANEWKPDNINGSSQYIDAVKYDEQKGCNYVQFHLTNYVLSTPLQFQFTPMPSADTKMGDDWWSYAISGSSKFANKKNNIYCDFSAKGGYNGCTIIVNKSTYEAWGTTFPIYGVSPTRWFNEAYSSCFEIPQDD